LLGGDELDKAKCDEGGREMNIQKLLIDFVTIFVVSLVVTAIVTFLWSLIVHGAGSVDWERSFGFAISFGIAFPLMRALESRGKEKWQGSNLTYPGLCGSRSLS